MSEWGSCQMAKTLPRETGKIKRSLVLKEEWMPTVLGQSWFQFLDAIERMERYWNFLSEEESCCRSKVANMFELS